MKKTSLLISIIGLLLYTSEIKAQTVTDIDGNEYPVITIGDQEWMGENMRVTQYNNGDEIENNPDHTYWQDSTEGLWEHYDQDPANVDLYGKLYNWHATVDERGLCPAGWRVPTDDDWQQLVEHVDPDAWGNNNSLGTKLKSCRQEGSPLGVDCDVTEHPRWDSHGRRFGTDEYGFGALPGGAYTMGAAFVNMGKYAYFWSTTSAAGNNAWTRVMLFSHRGMSRNQYNKSMGMAVRCVKGVEDEVQVPQINTLQVTDITQTTAVSGGDIISDGGAEVTERGIVWCTNSNPTLEENIDMTSDGSGMGAFTSDITGLQQETTYWVRAYATNEAGTAYGTQKRFTTLGEEVDETFTVTFTIEDEQGETIDDATVTFDGNENTSGDYIFEDIEPGTYDYKVEKEGYLSVEENLEVTDQDITVEIILEEEETGENEVNVNDVTGQPGETITIEVEVDNTDVIVAFQMDFALPEGFALVEGSITLTDRADDHSADYNELDNNVIRIISYSPNNNPYSGNKGIIMTFNLTTPEVEGEWELFADEVVLTNPDYQNILTGSKVGVITLVEEEDTFSCGDDVTFIYNGEEVTYGTVESANGTCWLDRNLGASRVATSSTDEEAYGYLYQWGRAADGHQIRTSGTTSTLSDSDTPGHGNFITTGSSPNDWRSPQNHDLWQSVNGKNNPCPDSYRLPTEAEWEIERQSWGTNDFAGAFTSPLKLSLTGLREFSNGSLSGDGFNGFYWSSTDNDNFSSVLFFYNTTARMDFSSRAYGHAVRCIKDSYTPPSSHTLNIEINPENSGTTEGAGEYEAGTEVNITATANEGYEFANWTTGEDVLSTETEYTYTMPDGDVNVVANFEEEDDETSWTPCPDMPTVEDIDGNVYNTVLIGEQCWLRENLRTTQYKDGDDIPTGLSDTEWENTTDGAYAIYPHEDIDGLESEAEVVEAYGKLYNWYAVDDSRGLCPTGWRVPSDAEWTELVDYVVDQGYPNEWDNPDGAGNALKSCRQVDSPLGGDCNTSEHPRWDSNDTHLGFDEFGFSGLQGGSRFAVGTFGGIGGGVRWWSSTELLLTSAWRRGMYTNIGAVDRGSKDKEFGYSVRCFRDID